MAALMFGLDFTESDLQLSLWNEDHTCAEMYNFTGMPGGETVSTVVTVTEDGRLLRGKEALDYSLKEQKNGIIPLYGRNVKEFVEINGESMPIEDLLTRYLEEVLSPIRRRFGGATVARMGITGERMTKKEENRISVALERLGYSLDKIYFSSHADAFVWYELCEGMEMGQMSSVAFDYDSEGMLCYQLHLAVEEQNIPYCLEKTDFTDVLPGGLGSIHEEEERKNKFIESMDLALSRKDAGRLYVTGMHVEGQAKALGQFSKKNRRLFCGRSLYSLGACYNAVREKFTKKVIGDNQIFHNVFLEAYKDAKNVLYPMATAGTRIDRTVRSVQVIVDDMKEIRFQIEDMRTKENVVCSVIPEAFRARENKTTRLEISVRFLDLETLVIKVRELGFGALYPASYRVWEQLVSLSARR